MNSANTPRYQVWSPKVIALVSLPMVVLTAVLVFRLGQSSVWVELQLTLLILFVCLLAFLTFGLYRGVRLEKPLPFTAESIKPASINVAGIGAIPLHDTPEIQVDVPNLSDAGDNLVGCLLTLVVWVVASILFAIAFWLAMQILFVGLPAVLLGSYWIYYRALRLVFAKSRACKGKLWSSLGYGLLYAVLYMGWLFALTWLSWFVSASGWVG